MSIPQDTEPAQWFISIIEDVASQPAVNREVRMMEGRAEIFPSRLAAQLAGIYMNPIAREYVDARLDEHWMSRGKYDVGNMREHIIGGGPHAAVYAATRARMGKGRPVVWEMRDPGGAFSVGGGKPVFRLQSRNRPGGPGIPALGNLNYLPGAVIQPSHIAGGEYPDNAVLRWCVRTTLAAYADVRFGLVASYADDFSTSLAVEDGSRYDVGRIIDARGIGTDSALLLPESGARRHVLTFFEFMDRMSSPFPLRGVKRMAVVGNGPSGAASVESGLGIAPVSHLSMPELDWVQVLDWYARDTPTTREAWVNEQDRSRLIEIGRYLPRAGRVSESRRLTVYNRLAIPLDGVDSATIDSRSYDLVVVCAGLVRRDGAMTTVPDPGTWAEYTPPTSSTAIARRYQEREVYAIGPITRLPLTSRESELILSNAIPGNALSILRLAPKTAALAMGLG
jgi:hypothetical protein